MQKKKMKNGADPDPKAVIPDPKAVIPDPIYLATTLLIAIIPTHFLC